MRITIANLFIVFVLFFIFSNDAYSAFSSQGIIKNTSFSTGVWSPPAAPVLKSPSSDFATNHDQFFEWFEPTVFYFSPITYHLEFYDSNPLLPGDHQSVFCQEEISLTRFPQTGTLPLDEGTYWWRVKAVDSINQESAWSEARKITIDKTSPSTTIRIENGGIKNMEEQIDDGTFEKYSSNLDDSEFTHLGEVFLLTGGDSYLSDAHDGNKMVRVGDTNAHIEGSNIMQNNLSYTFPNNSKNISFYWNYFSSDEYPFDDPGFIFKINGETVFDVGADDVSGSDLIKSTDWKQFYYDVSEITGNVTLDFYAGNSGDAFRQSWIYIDEIKTGRTIVNTGAKFLLTSSENGPIFYCFDECDDDNLWFEYREPFSVNANMNDGNHVLYFYAKDGLGNKENPLIKNIYIDNTSPLQITDLTQKEIKNDAASFVFTAPAEVAGYEIRIFDSQDKLINQMSLAPSAPGVLEEFTVNNLESNKTYHVVLKSFDAAVNYSLVSNIVEFKTTLKKGDIVIQELLYDAIDIPEESHEWIKLYNATNETIDLKNWYVLDNSSSSNKIDTTIDAKTFLILTPSVAVIQNKYPFFNGQISQISEMQFGDGLASTGDYIKLFGQNNIQWDELGWKEDSTIWPNCQLRTMTGQSLVRKTLGIDTDSETDWIINSNPLFPPPSL